MKDILGTQGKERSLVNWEWRTENMESMKQSKRNIYDKTQRIARIQ